MRAFSSFFFCHSVQVLVIDRKDSSSPEMAYNVLRGTLKPTRSVGCCLALIFVYFFANVHLRPLFGAML